MTAKGAKTLSIRAREACLDLTWEEPSKYCHGAIKRSHVERPNALELIGRGHTPACPRAVLSI